MSGGQWPPTSRATARTRSGAAQAPTVARSESESDSDDRVQRLRVVRARHALDAGTDSERGGGGGSGSGPLAPQKSFFWRNDQRERACMRRGGAGSLGGGCGRLKLVGASLDGFLSRSLLRRIRSFASPVTGGESGRFRFQTNHDPRLPG